MASSGYVAWSVIAGETPTTTKWNLLGSNDASFNTGQGFNDGALVARHFGAGAIKGAYAQITANFNTTSTTAVQVTGLSISFTMPAGGRSVKLTLWTGGLYNSTASAQVVMQIWDGTVGTGTAISFAYGIEGGSSASSATAIAVVTPTAGAAKTYNASLKASATTSVMEASTTGPAFLMAEFI